MQITKVSFHGRQISSFLNTVTRDPDTSEGKEGSCRLPVSDNSVHPGGKGLLSRAVPIYGREERKDIVQRTCSVISFVHLDPTSHPSPFPSNSTMLFVYKSEPRGLNNPGNPSKT